MIYTFPNIKIIESRGNGKEIAIGYASLGAIVICCDINEEANKQTMKKILEMGINSVYAYK